MQKSLTPAERLIVAADFEPPEGSGRFWVEEQVMNLAKTLARTGVILKINSALRTCGHGLIDQIHELGLGVFADLKLYDIPNTLTTDGAFLRRSRPEILTVVCSAGASAMQALKAELPDTEVLGVTVLTSISHAECLEIYGSNPSVVACKFAQRAEQAGLDGIISSAEEIKEIRKVISPDMTINTPGIRPLWTKVVGDDQKRIMTPAEAIRAGADRIVVGRPIVRAENPYDAVMRTIEEIASAMT